MAQLMRAVKTFKYPPGVKRRPGDTFTAKGRHALQLAIAGLAVEVSDADADAAEDAKLHPNAPDKPTRAYETRHMEAKPVKTHLDDGGKYQGEYTPKPVSAMTVLELREYAEDRGIALPRGFIAKATLQDIIERA